MVSINLKIFLFLPIFALTACSSGGGSSEPSGDSILNEATFQREPTVVAELDSTEFNSIRSSMNISVTNFLSYIGSPRQIVNYIEGYIFNNGASVCSSSELGSSPSVDANSDNYPDSGFSGSFSGCTISGNSVSGSFTSSPATSYRAVMNLEESGGEKSYTIAEWNKSGSGSNLSATYRSKVGILNGRSQYNAVWLTVEIENNVPRVNGFLQLYKESGNIFKTYKLGMSSMAYDSATECIGGNLYITDDTNSVSLQNSGGPMLADITALGGNGPVFCLK